MALRGHLQDGSAILNQRLDGWIRRAIEAMFRIQGSFFIAHLEHGRFLFHRARRTLEAGIG